MPTLKSQKHSARPAYRPPTHPFLPPPCFTTFSLSRNPLGPPAHFCRRASAPFHHHHHRHRRRRTCFSWAGWPRPAPPHAPPQVPGGWGRERGRARPPRSPLLLPPPPLSRPPSLFLCSEPRQSPLPSPPPLSTWPTATTPQRPPLLRHLSTLSRAPAVPRLFERRNKQQITKVCSGRRGATQHNRHTHPARSN